MASSTLSRVDSIPSTRMMEISRRDYDASFTTVRTPRSRSRSFIQRRSSSASRLGRSYRISQLPPFPLGAISVDEHQKRGGKDLVISIDHCTPSTGPVSPRSSVGGSFRLSGSHENSAQGQVMVAQRAVRPWPPLPFLQMPATSDPTQEQPQEPKASRSQANHLSRPPPHLTSTALPFSPSLTEDYTSSPEQHTATNVTRGSDIIRRKRTYDPTRNVVEPDDLRLRTTNGRERWPTASGWPRGDGDWCAIPSNASSHQTGSSLRRDPGPIRPNARRNDTFGARSRRSVLSNLKEENRRSSLDLDVRLPNSSMEYEPASPSTAPVLRTSIVPVIPSSVASPPSVDPDTRRNAVATGTAPGVDAMSSTRVRFGARPMRSALLAEGFRESEEEGVPWGYLLQPTARGFDKSQ
jgi:hypothetical protein